MTRWRGRSGPARVQEDSPLEASPQEKLVNVDPNPAVGVPPPGPPGANHDAPRVFNRALMMRVMKSLAQTTWKMI